MNGGMQPSPRARRSLAQLPCSPVGGGWLDDDEAVSLATPSRVPTIKASSLGSEGGPSDLGEARLEKRQKRLHAMMDPTSPASRGALLEDDDAFLVASPARGNFLSYVPKSPFQRPVAPKESFYKSPPPVVTSDRVERIEMRQKRQLNVQAAESQTYRDLGSLSPLEDVKEEKDVKEGEEEEAEAGDESFTSEKVVAFSTCGSVFSTSVLSQFSCNRRPGDTDTPPSGARAFEGHETLVKCPAPKRSRSHLATSIAPRSL